MFAGSVIGFLYDHSLSATIIFCVASEVDAILFFIWTGSRSRAAEISHRGSG